MVESEGTPIKRLIPRAAGRLHPQVWLLVLLSLLPVLSGFAQAPPAGSLSRSLDIKDPLNHDWTDELVHFDLKWSRGPADVSLLDRSGRPVAFQLTDAQRDTAGALVSARMWTVVSMKAGDSLRLQVEPGKPSVVAAGVSVARERGELVLRNGRMGVRVPQLPGELAAPVPLTELPAPLLGVQRTRGGDQGSGAPAGEWLGSGRWVNEGAPLLVRDATTTVVSNGPVFVLVRQQLTFTNGGTYTAEVRLAARQDAALVTEHSTVDAPKAAFRFSMQSGLNADRVFWQAQQEATGATRHWSRLTTATTADKERVLFRLRPWSFWWLKNVAQWAGFYREGGEEFVGVLLLRPSRWTPGSWAGFERTEIPVTTGPGGRVHLDLALLAQSGRGVGAPAVPLHREWAVTAGTVAEHVVDGKATPRLRRQLIQHSEFPLDEVKEYGFDFTSAQPARSHPFLLFDRADVERVRHQAGEANSARAAGEDARKYIAKLGAVEQTLEKEGAAAFYTRHYVGGNMVERLPEAYLGSADPRYGRMLGAAVKGLTEQIRETLLESPVRPSLGALGPWFTESVTRLLFNYDLIAGTEFLDAASDRAARNTLVFAAQMLAHPDYWNTGHGLASANPNMTSSIILPQGLLALMLEGHPQSERWLAAAEGQLQRELKEWVTPGGAWVESPGYQSASLDGIFLLAQAVRNVKGRDYFADPQLRATMDYYGFLLTPPDPRFPTRKTGGPSPATLPSIGDTFSGHVTAFNGWMAAATAGTDPAYSRRQQFFWNAQRNTLESAGRAKGFMLALTDPGLPAEPPADLARSFPGFGSVLRTSWTDPKATYVAHRTGPLLHHYHDDYNSFVLYAKGAPLCADFGNLYQPVHRREAWYHNRVSWDIGSSPKHYGTTGQIGEVRSLAGSADYSLGRSTGSGGQANERALLLVKSPDPMGANYLVMRDRTTGGPAGQTSYWNFWCLARSLEAGGRPVNAAEKGGAPAGRQTASGGGPFTFVGQHGVDLDVHVLSPSQFAVETDRWSWKQQIYVWGAFEEEQVLLRLARQGPGEDFLTVLNPRTGAEAPAQVSPLAGGAGARVKHAEGTDVVVLSPGRATVIQEGDVTLEAEVGLVRMSRTGARLVLVNGTRASARGWTLRGAAPVSLAVGTRDAHGETSGAAQSVSITPPTGVRPRVTVDGKPSAARMEGGTLRLDVSAGSHAFRLTW